MDNQTAQILEVVRNNLDNPIFTHMQSLQAIVSELRHFLEVKRQREIKIIHVPIADFIQACRVMTEPVVMGLCDDKATLLSDPTDRFFLQEAGIYFVEAKEKG